MKNPSPQQQAFFDFVTNGEGNAVLQAVAGAGKTTTVVEALKLMNGSVFFGAYNKKIADEIANRTTGHSHVTASTFHAAGFSAWRKACSNVKVDANKVREMVWNYLEPFSKFSPAVISLIAYAKQVGIGIGNPDDIDQHARWQALIDHFNIEIIDVPGINGTQKVINAAIHLLKQSNEMCSSVIDFDDMIYAPLFFNLKVRQFDWVLIDEAQDINFTRRTLAYRMLKKGGRIIAVGDKHQSIYGFTGADINALAIFAVDVNAAELPLTVTFRCPKTVVAYATQWVSHITAHESAPDGEVVEAEEEDLLKTAKVGDAILCRFTKPLVDVVYKFIAARIPAKIEGREIGEGLKKLVQRWKVKSFTALEERLHEYRDRETKKLEAKRWQEAKIQALSDKVECALTFVEMAREKNPDSKEPVKCVVDEIQAVFSDEVGAAVVILSTIHKSKGREWDHVVWLQTGPSTRAKQEWEMEQERNLCYVAATRAKKKLTLVQVRRK